MPKPRRNAKPPSKTPHNPPSRIPPPFTPAPPTLESFLETLDPSHIYLTSLDAHPIAFKRRIFAIPLMLNCFLLICLLWRLQVALPVYRDIFAGVLGYETPQKVDVRNMERGELAGIGGKRALMFLGDFVLARFVGMWPWGFFLGTRGLASPVGWRRWVKFREVEVVVRRSRRWDRELFFEEKADWREVEREGVKEGFLEDGREGKVFRDRVLPAVEKEWVTKKTGYTLMDKSWDLYFGGMIQAHGCIDRGDNTLDDFRTSVIVHTEKAGWVIWEVWRKHGDGAGDEGTMKLRAVKDKLMGMGKEGLFFRWIEVVQNETSQAGDLTVEKQKKAVQKVREEFEEEGVDFDWFWKDVGGLESMPGMEITG